MKIIMSSLDTLSMTGIVIYPCSDPGYQGIKVQ